MLPKLRSFTVSGIFELGMQEYDANLALVSFSRYNDKLDGQVLVFFIITVAAAEVAVGLAILVALFRARQTTDLKDISTLKF